MKNVARAVPAVALVAAICAAPLARAASRPAPPVEFAMTDGSVLSLSRLVGKVVLVDFWASWCAPCARSFPALDQLYREFHDQGLEVVAVSVDEDRRAALAFLAQRPHTLPVALDPKGALAHAFKIEGMPSSVLIDGKGVIRYAHTGFNDATLASWRRELHELLLEAAREASR
jgi:thiol-disulfide isomerase/thioredoxin